MMGPGKPVAGSARKLAAAAYRAGQADVRLYRQQPGLLASLPLGRFNDIGMRGMLLRRALLRVRFPILLLAAAGRLLGGRHPAWNRFLDSYGYWRGVQDALRGDDIWGRLTRGPVVLMYHALGQGGEPPSRYVLPVRRLGQQMGWLQRRGYRVLSLSDLVRCRREQSLPPARSVIITFDDGYQDTATLAAPILRRYGFPCTVFLVTQAAERANGWDRDAATAGRPLLSWAAARSLLGAGVEFGSHSSSHPFLTELRPDQLEQQIAGSRRELEAQLGQDVVVFAYPGGRHDARTRLAVERAGFLAACGSEPGVNDACVPLYALRRNEIRGTGGLVDFALTLWAGKPRVLTRLWRAQ